jgi:hypothetical protein
MEGLISPLGTQGRKGRSVKKQSTNRTRKPRSVPKQRKTSYVRLVEFPQARGRTVERVELSADSDFPCVSIRFTDNTDLTVVIDTALSFQADYSRWKAGNQKILKRWPVFRSAGT